MKKFVFNSLKVIFPKNVIVWRGKTNNKRIALTFDDGPNPERTLEILRILKEHNIKATFFLVGEQIMMAPNILEEIFKLGHLVGNHAYRHCHAKKNNEKEFIRGINATQDLIRKTIGKAPIFFRPPHGELTLRILLHIIKNRMVTVLWSVDPKDFQFNNLDLFLKQFYSQKFINGDILLLHDNSHLMVRALPKIINFLKKNGFEFVTVSALLNKVEYHE